jgi:DNA mismatch repair protein MutL
MTIRILSPIIINRIAAGEVIERPASVIKELVENSIDAGSTKIEIDIENGGKNLIRITDDGKGMSKDDLELCILRHATSKLPNDDLFNINSFGFRGEAIPSIGSISRLSISSKKIGESEAWKIILEAGETKDLIPTKLNTGTIVEVRDLFFATPARLNFLKSDNTEKAKIIEVIKKISMANPETGFVLRDGVKQVISYKANLDIIDSQEQRLKEIIGKDFIENAVRIDNIRSNARLTGFVSLPTYNASTTLDQYIFVNNRPVRDKVLLGAIRGAYADFISKDRFPVVVLFINLPPEEVDVNVHPAKAEVRFRFESEIRGLIVGSIKNSLAEAGHRASSTISNFALSSFVPNNQQDKADFYYQSNSNHNFNREFVNNSATGFYENKKSGYISPSNVTQIFQPIETKPLSKFELPSQEEENLLNYPMGSAKAQYHENYIISQTHDGIILVDQHAAHERLVYEKMKKEFSNKEVKTQKLLIPEIVETSEEKTIELINKSQELSDFGLVIEKFGNNAILVKEVPEILCKENIFKLINDIAEDIIEYGQELSLKEKIEHILETIACHGSIRSGRKLNIEEMNSLLREMERTPYSGQCNHGRPTYIKLKLTDIEKLFGRK